MINEVETNGKDKQKKILDRPIECTECKKSIAVQYTEILGETRNAISMCAECPTLQRKLKGLPQSEKAEMLASGSVGLACGNCGTTLEAIRVGTPLGCSHCYEVFENRIISELNVADKIPQRMANNKKAHPLHIGRGLGEMPEISPSARLLALSEALNETLKKEDYEQAAWLRDQIRALTGISEKKDERL